MVALTVGVVPVLLMLFTLWSRSSPSCARGPTRGRWSRPPILIESSTPRPEDNDAASTRASQFDSGPA